MFSKKNKVNVLRLEGVISNSGKKSLSFKNYKKQIDKAFEDKKAKAVALIINSPGGSPSQSEIIANYIIAKAEKEKKQVITFAEDVAASGGYWLSLVGEKFFALSKTSIVGSLGVVYASFGLEDFISKHNIKRRVYTAGKNKVSLDIFQEEKEADIQRLNDMLVKVHNHFKDWVLQRRGKKITIEEEELFSGEFWIASSALEKGLIDGICNLEDKLKELYGEKIKINYLEVKKGFIGNLISGKKIINQEELVADIAKSLKEEVLWNKFGM